MIHWGPQHLGSIGTCGKPQNFIDGRLLSLYVHGSSINYLCGFGQVAQLQIQFTHLKNGKNCGESLTVAKRHAVMYSVIESRFRLKFH